jgi:uncharacterized protein
MTERLPPGSPCTQCGRCCTNESYMRTLYATSEDVKRWRREKRYDILRFVYVLGDIDDPTDDPPADLWIDSEARANQNPERSRCPFVRKIRNTNRYTCTIYETRPQVCRDYEPWNGNDVCEVVD